MTSDAISTASRLCFFSHYDADDLIDAYVVHYLQQLRSAGFVTVLVTTSRPDAHELEKVAGLCAAVVRRENVGLDFGGWSECLARYPDVAPEELLLCNDSVYGPFWSLAEFIAKLTASPADAYAAVVSLDPVPHMTSWFLLLRRSAYRSAAFQELMRNPVPSSMPKEAIVQTYEMGLSRGLAEAGLTFRGAFDPRGLGPILSRYPMNPTYNLWRELLDKRLVPFVKIGILRDRPLSVRGLKAWRAVTEPLDAVLTETAARNLRRRAAGRRRPRFERLRELIGMPTLRFAQTPMAARFVRADLERGLAGEHGSSRGFDALCAAYELFRRPYARVYDRIGALRRRG